MLYYFEGGELVIIIEYFDYLIWFGSVFIGYFGGYLGGYLGYSLFVCEIKYDFNNKFFIVIWEVICVCVLVCQYCCVEVQYYVVFGQFINV